MPAHPCGSGSPAMILNTHFNIVMNTVKHNICFFNKQVAVSPEIFLDVQISSHYDVMLVHVVPLSKSEMQVNIHSTAEGGTVPELYPPSKKRRKLSLSSKGEKKCRTFKNKRLQLQILCI